MSAASEDWVSGYWLLTLLVKRPRLIGACALLGAILTLALTYLQPRLYRASALFLPQSTEVQPSGLAQMASRFGVGLDASGGQWGPAVYVELLKTRNVLETVVLDSIASPFADGRRLPVIEVLGYDASDPTSVEAAIEKLSGLFQAGEITEISGVELVVKTAWPGVSYGLAERLIDGLNAYNLSQRRTQAVQEREFVEDQVAQARAKLLEAEDGLLSFLKQNRSIVDSPELMYQRERLAREISLRQAVYTSLVSELAEVRIREVRTTPVITMLEDPRLPTMPVPRGLALRVLLGLLAGTLAGVFWVLLRGIWTRAASSATGDAAEFFRVVGHLGWRHWWR